MRIISAILSLLLLLGLSVCASEPETSTNRPVQLTPAMFNDYELTLISDKDYGYYLFLDDGRAEVSFGQKNGGVVGLTYGWKIKGTNTLVFTSLPYGLGPEERFSWQFKSFGKNTVVTMDGQKFKRTKFKRPN